MGGQNSKNETGRKEISSAPADARSWSRCDYVFAWMAEQQAPSRSGFLSTFWLPTLTPPLDTMLHNGLDPHPNEHVAVYEPPSAASDHLRPKGRKCLTGIVKKTRLLSAVGLHVDVLREVVGLSRFYRRRNKLTQKQQHPENFDRQQQTKAT